MVEQDRVSDGQNLGHTALNDLFDGFARSHDAHDQANPAGDVDGAINRVDHGWQQYGLSLLIVHEQANKKG